MADLLTTDIAITGMSCRVPGARSVAAFHDMLSQGRGAFRPLSTDEVIAAGVPLSVATSPAYVRVAAPLEGIDEFDVNTLGLTPGETAAIDPQHYHFLECTYEALHLAANPPGSGSTRVGVFAGADLSYFAAKRVSDDVIWDPMGHWQDLMGNDSHFMATSVSYRLGLTGPSVGVQTACSTSLVAVHMAVQALISGDCDVAVAGGVSIRGPQTRGYLYREGSILSPTGRCRPFDKDADGTMLSSGVGVVVLMRLIDAIDEKIPVWAIIKGSAVNNDGNRKVGYTAPSVEGQAAVITEALSVAKVDPASVVYIEAHGTGTRLGDPIEYRGLLAAYKPMTSNSPNIRLGSVKSNFGHLESAAGVAALIKATLSIHYGEVYPSLGFVSPNPEIDFTNSPFRVADRYEKLPPCRDPRQVAVSSFGIGGTNCHVVLETAPSGTGQRDGSNVLELRSFPFRRRKVWSPPVDRPTVTVRRPTSPHPPDAMDPAVVLAGIWRDVLGRGPGLTDDFLSSGGDSLKATQVAVKVKEALGADLAIEDILDASNFGALTDTLVRQVPSRADGDYPLTAGQQSLWLWQSLNPQSPAYTVQAVFSLQGALDVMAIQAAIGELVIRQDALRTAIVEVDGEARQRVTSYCAPVPWRYVESAVDRASALSLVVEHGRTLIDLSRPPLLSVLLIRTAEEEHLLSVVSHHIVSDEWSAQVMLGDVLEFYAARTQMRPATLSLLGTSMGQVAEQEQHWLSSPAAEARTRYWKTKLAGAPRFDLPPDRQLRGVRSHSGAVLPFVVDKDTYAKVRQLAQVHKATPFMVLVTVFNTLWFRYSGQSDLCIGTNIAGREAQDTSDLVGLFTNTVPLRTDLSGNPTFSEALHRVRRTALEAYEHQLPFPLVVDAVRPPHMPSRNPLFDAMLVMQNVPQRMLKLPQLEVVSFPVHNGTSKFDMELTLLESGDGTLFGQWEYDTDLFDGRTIEQLSRHYAQLIQSALASPDEHLSRLSLVSAEERAALLDEWNRTNNDFGIGVMDHGAWDLFVEQARRRGAAPAIVSSGKETVSYDRLANDSSALAARLRQAGVSPGSLVGVFCERSANYIQAILAVQACGAAFLPLDPSLPALRMTDVLRDSQARHVITCKEYRDRLDRLVGSAGSGAVVSVLLDESEETNVTSSLVSSPVSADLAYVIYTSGSTGKPKGAMVSRAGMLNHLYAKIQTLGLQETTRMAFTAPLSFDISIWQCMAPLLAGGTVVVISDDEVMDLRALCDRLSCDRVDVAEFVPSYLDALLAHMESRAVMLSELRFMVATGERLAVETCRHWFDLFPRVPLVNAYGPTECADDVLQYVLKEKPASCVSSIPIGYSLPNVRVFVLDAEMVPVPVGAVGEIYVGGVCVGFGYLNDPDRTAAAFLPDPFSSEPGARLYRTGDLGRRRPDGAIEYLGRVDNQVKVHGARVEVEEVEALIRQCAGVGEVAVVPTERGDSLVALVTPPPSGPVVDVHRLREQARVRLPGFMLPSAFLVVNAIPKTSSGKVDRAALPHTATRVRPVKPASREDNTHTSGTVLAELRDIWCRVLDMESVPDDADFFEVGGDSLKTIRVASLAQRDGLAVTPADLVAHPVLRDLAGHCIEKVPSLGVRCSARVDGNLPLTLGERWFLEQEFPDAHLRDSGFLLTLAPQVLPDSVARAVSFLWQKHEGLRARFDKNADGAWRKTILPDSVPEPYSIVDMSGMSPELASQLIVAERNRILSQDGPLFRVTSFTSDGLNRLLVVAHYLACDLVSWQILLDEFEDALSNNTTPGPAPLTPPNHDATVLGADQATCFLSAEETIRLRQYANDSGVDIETILVSSFIQAASVVQRTASVSVWLGRHGRSCDANGNDNSQAVGRLSHPELLTVAASMGDSLQQVLQRVRDLTLGDSIGQPVPVVPGKDGITVTIDYLGDTPMPSGAALTRIEPLRRRSATAFGRAPAIEVVAQVTDGILSVRVHCPLGDSDGNAMSLLMSRALRNLSDGERSAV